MNAFDVIGMRTALEEAEKALHEGEVPVGAAINEAVELAKAFGEEKSSGFINGILGSVARAQTDE